MEIKVKCKDADLFTIVKPDSSKETVVLLHGGPGVPEDLSPLIEFLSQDFQVIYFHQRGTFKSPCFSGDYAISRYIADINDIAAHFKLQKFHLFGHSWGGLYAQLYAAQNPDRLLSMFLCSPATGTGKQWAKMATEIWMYNKHKSTLLKWLAMNKDAALGLLGSDQAHRRFYKQFGLNCNRAYGINTPAPLLIELLKADPINGTNKSVLQFPELKELLHTGYKTTVTFSDDDIYGDSIKYTKARLPEADFYSIPESGHNPWLHNHKVFMKIMGDHFR